MEIVDNLPNAQIAQAVQELDSDDAVYILEDLEQEDQDEILAQLPFTERIRLRRSLDYPEETAGRRMQTEFVAVPPFWTVGQTIDYMREDKNLPERFSQIFVIDPTFKLLGAIDLDQILRTKRSVKIEEVMHETRHAIPATMDQEEAARDFEQYDLLRRRRRRERAAGRRADHRRRGRRHPAGGRGGSVAHGRRRRRRAVGQHCLDLAFARALAARQSFDGFPGGVGDQPVRRHDRADGGARRADADRRRHGRQCRHADHDGHRARAGDARSRHLQCRPHHPPRDGGRASQRHHRFAILLG